MTSPAAGTPRAKGSKAKASQASGSGSAILFRAHAVFHGTIHTNESNHTGGQSQHKRQFLSLPAGDYWVLIDFTFHKSPEIKDPTSFGGDAFFALLDANGQPRQADTLSTLSDKQFGRFSHRLTLAAPFFGDFTYGGGSFGTEEMWLWIVPARDDIFVPFAFGATPRPLKKGANAGAQGTLKGGMGDYYYTQLPAGFWRITLKATTAAPPPNLPNGGSVGFIAEADLLDEQGVDMPNASLMARFLPEDALTHGAAKVIKVDTPEFIKLHVFSSAYQMGLSPGNPQASPMTYVLKVEPASASEYQPPAAGS